MAELTIEQKRALAMAAARKRLQDQQQPAPQQPAAPQQSHASGLMDAFTQGASFGFGDELTGLESAVLGRTPEGGWFEYDRPFGERYQRAVDAERGQQQQFSQQNPMQSGIAEVAGALATGAGAARQGATLAGRAATTRGAIGAGAAEGSIYGGAYGAGNADGGDRLAGAAGGAVTGGVAGGAIGGATDKIARALSRRAAMKAAPSTQELKQQGGAALDAARAANETYDGFDNFAMNLYQKMGDQALDPQLHPQMAQFMNSVEELSTGGTRPTYRQLEILRKRLATPAGTFGNKEQQRLALIARNELDDYMATKGGPQATQGRELWGRYKRSELLDDATTKAARRAASTGSGGNTENAMRQNIRQILDNPKKRRGFSQEELAMMEEIVRGAPVQNMLRLAGKLSPSGNGLMAALGLGATVANPAMAAFPVAGMAAKSVADQQTMQNIARLLASVRSGKPVVGQGANPNQQAIARALSGYIGGNSPMPVMP